MKVLGSKRERSILQDQKSEQTTAVNSNTHSRRNSSFLTVSKDSQSLILPVEKIIFDQQPKRNKKCLNVTVNRSKLSQAKTDRDNNAVRRQPLLGFNFCQQVANKQNFYTQLIDVQKVHQILNPPIKQLKPKQAKGIGLKKASSTLNSPKSPINQLIELLDESQDDLAAELQMLLEKL